MKSKTKISKQLTRKRNPDLVETILLSKKLGGWIKVSEILSSPRSRKTETNIGLIDKEAKEGETIVIPGKVLSTGDISKKVNVIALSFSEMAKEKIQNAGGKVLNLLDEIKKNPDAKEIRIIINK